MSLAFAYTGECLLFTALIYLALITLLSIFVKQCPERNFSFSAFSSSKFEISESGISNFDFTKISNVFNADLALFNDYSLLDLSKTSSNQSTSDVNSRLNVLFLLMIIEDQDTYSCDLVIIFN